MKKRIARILMLTIAIVAISPYLMASNHARQWRARCLTQGKYIGGWTHRRSKANARRADHKRRYPRHRMTIRTRRH